LPSFKGEAKGRALSRDKHGFKLMSLLQGLGLQIRGSLRVNVFALKKNKKIKNKNKKKERKKERRKTITNV